jgi:anti-anti-sigma regulatory factor
MPVELHREGDVTVARLTGELTVAHAAETAAALSRALEDGAELVVDLGGAGEADVSLLQTICALHRRAAGLGRKVRLAGAEREPMRSLVAVTGFASHRLCPYQADRPCLWNNGGEEV